MQNELAPYNRVKKGFPSGVSVGWLDRLAGRIFSTVFIVDHAPDEQRRSFPPLNAWQLVPAKAV